MDTFSDFKQILSSVSASGSAILCLALMVVAGLVLYPGLLGSRKESVPLPPGPKPKFLIGNLMDIPTTNAAECYIEWGKKYHSELFISS